MPQIRSCSMSDGRQMASTASAFVVALPVVDPGSWPRPAGCLPRRVRPRRAAQRLPSRPVCPDRCCSCAWLSRRKSWLDFLTFFRAGSTGHPPTSRWPAVQNFENELHFFPVSVLRKICTIKQFTIFERGRNGHSSNDLFLIPQNPAPASQPRVSSLSPPRLNPHPVEPPRRLVVAGQKRIFNLEPGHDSGVHRVLLDETLKMVCLAFCGRLVSPREVRRRVVTRSDRDGTA